MWFPVQTTREATSAKKTSRQCNEQAQKLCQDNKWCNAKHATALTHGQGVRKERSTKPHPGETQSPAINASARRQDASRCRDESQPSGAGSKAQRCDGPAGPRKGSKRAQPVSWSHSTYGAVARTADNLSLGSALWAAGPQSRSSGARTGLYQSPDELYLGTKDLCK